MVSEADLDLVERLKAARGKLLAAELAEAKLARKLHEARHELKKLRKAESDLLTELAAPAPMPLFCAPDGQPTDGAPLEEDQTTTRPNTRTTRRPKESSK